VNWGLLFKGFLFGVLCLFDVPVHVVVNAVHVKDFDGHVVFAEIFIGPH